jgi:hypothetical protein
MNTEGTGSHTYKECHKTESPWNHTSTAHKEREQSGDRRSDGESSCNSGDGTGQMAQHWMFMMMMMNDKWVKQTDYLRSSVSVWRDAYTCLIRAAVLRIVQNWLYCRPAVPLSSRFWRAQPLLHSVFVPVFISSYASTGVPLHEEPSNHLHSCV